MDLTRRIAMMGLVLAAGLGPAVTPVQAAGTASDPGALRLLMVEQKGCHYCKKWKREIGPAWPNSAEATIAPLEFVDLRGTWPEGITIGARPAFTPTFILLKDNAEVSRLEGYPGDHFFWGLLDQMLTAAGAVLPAPGQQPAASMAPAM